MFGGVTEELGVGGRYFSFLIQIHLIRCVTLYNASEVERQPGCFSAECNKVCNNLACQ